MIIATKKNMTQIFEEGQVVPVTLVALASETDLKAGEKIKVTGTTKGKGFQGVVKRWGFKGGTKTHGNKHSLRAPGSIGSAFPQKVFKGKKMGGQMGGKRKTILNLEIIKVSKKNKELAIKGAIPGKIGGSLQIEKI